MGLGVVALLGSLDTKGREYAYVRDLLVDLGCDVLLIDTGVMGSALTKPDVHRSEVAAAGGHHLDELRASADRGAAMQTMAKGASVIVGRLRDEGRISAVMALGGSNAAFVMAVVCAQLPIGFPKLLVSTMAAGDTRPYVGITDLTLMYPVVDINGLNRISRTILTNAANACAAMAKSVPKPASGDPPVAAISMMGVTTRCGAAIEEQLRENGIEALTFHTTGVGGRAMEALLRSGHIQGVADMTTSELADEIVGGAFSAGPDRLSAAGQKGVPQVVSLGGLDMVKFGPRASVPPRFRDRLFLEHNPGVTLMRTSVDECAAIGRGLAAKLNAAIGRTALLIPTRGLSQLSVEGQPFHDPVADTELITSLREHLEGGVDVQLFDADINDPQVATAATEILIDWVKDGGE